MSPGEEDVPQLVPSGLVILVVGFAEIMHLRPHCLMGGGSAGRDAAGSCCRALWWHFSEFFKPALHKVRCVCTLPGESCWKRTGSPLFGVWMTYCLLVRNCSLSSMHFNF